jgi:hypothetical protein
MILHDSIQLYDTIIQIVLTLKNETKIKIANKTNITFLDRKILLMYACNNPFF